MKKTGFIIIIIAAIAFMMFATFAISMVVILPKFMKSNDIVESDRNDNNNDPIQTPDENSDNKKPTTPDVNTDNKKPTYTAYKIGEEVTLKDGTVWYVIENSGSTSDTVTLFASKNIKKDASGWTTVQSEYIIAFDGANVRKKENNSYCDTLSGCNMYASNGSTVTEDSEIKKFIDGSVTTYINNSLMNSGGTKINSIRLITTDEICNIINSTDSSNNCIPATDIEHQFVLTESYKNVPNWLYSTGYWTMTPPSYNRDSVFVIWSYTKQLAVFYSQKDWYVGARPVIVTSKSNIK